MNTPSANAFTYPAYVQYMINRVTHSFALQIVATAVGWQVYAITHNPIYLAYIGLAVFLPSLILVLPSGYIADHYNRRAVVGICVVLEIVSALGMVWFSLGTQQAIWPVFVYLTMFGTAAAFGSPAAMALAPNLLAKEALGQRLRPATAAMIARAESRSEGLALLLMSPEFQRR